MGAWQSTNRKAVYSDNRRGNVAGLLLIALMLVMILLLSIGHLVKSFQAFLTIQIAFLLGLAGLAIWNFKGQTQRVVTDQDGIRAFDAKNQEIGNASWSEITSYEPDQGAEGDRIGMVVRSAKSEIRISRTLSGFTRLNATILQNLPANVAKPSVTAKSLLPNRNDLVLNGPRTFGRLNRVPALLLAVIGPGLALLVMLIAIPHNPSQQGATHSLFGMAGFLIIAGLCGIVHSVNDKYVISPEGISHTDWTGREIGNIAWKDVLALEYKRRTGGGRGANWTYYYKLLGRNNHIAWIRRLPNGTTSSTSSLATRLQKPISISDRSD